MVASYPSSTEKIEQFRGKLVVSCQASVGEPLCSPQHIAALALSAINGGASALRLEGADNVAYVRERVSIPIVGLTKSDDVPESQRLSCVYITPTFSDASQLAAAGADIIAMDATQRPRPGGEDLVTLVARIGQELHRPVWADVSTISEGLAAADAGVHIVSTTLSGYTAQTAGRPDEPDFDLLRDLIKQTALPVVLEGRVWTPAHVTRAFSEGAFAVVVGSAITRPQLITRRFVDAIPPSP